jgi:hypothetical protein
LVRLANEPEPLCVVPWAPFPGRHHCSLRTLVSCYPLSCRNLEEMMAERGLTVDHSTPARWVLHCAPILEERIRREIRRPNRSWRVVETYIRVAGQWTYLYRAVNSAGETIDSLLLPKRDRVAAKGFLQSAAFALRSQSASCDQRGRPSFVFRRYRGTEAEWRTGTAMPVPPITVQEQHHRTGSSFCEETSGGEPVKGAIVGQARFIERAVNGPEPYKQATRFIRVQAHVFCDTTSNPLPSKSFDLRLCCHLLPMLPHDRRTSRKPPARTFRPFALVRPFLATA